MINKKQIVLSLALIMSLTSIVSADSWALAQETTTLTQTSWTWEDMMTTTSSTSAEVSWVDVVDSNTLSVNFSGNLTNGVSETSDVKLFKDMKVASSEKDLDNAKKITVKLDEELDFGGFDYSLFSVSSIDTSIDFNLSSSTSGEVKNTVTGEDGIDSIKIVDAKTIEVNLRKPLTTDLTDLKLLKEVKVASMFFDVWTLNVKTTTPLLWNSDYFFMFVSLKDKIGSEIRVSNSMYDFKTPELKTEELSSASGTLAWTWTELTASWAMPIETAAMQATATPDTWAKTNILLAIALLLGLAFIALRKKSFRS